MSANLFGILCTASAFAVAYGIVVFVDFLNQVVKHWEDK